MPIVRRAAAVFFSLALLAAPAVAQIKYDPGASDTEIKLGQTMPSSGPLSGFITLAKAEMQHLTRENVIRQSTNLKDFHPALLLSGVNMNTNPIEYQQEVALQQFNGERFEVFSALLSARQD